MTQTHLNAIAEVFDRQGHAWTEPYVTTEGAINRHETGDHRGLYWILPEVNFYFGKAATNTVIARHHTHRPKLDVDLATLYGPPVPKIEPRWSFPQGFKQGVCKYIIQGVDHIPSHFVRTGPRSVKPGVLHFPVTHQRDVDTLPVWVWNLEHLTAGQISALEQSIIPAIWPYCNNQTHRRRQRELKTSP